MPTNPPPIDPRNPPDPLHQENRDTPPRGCPRNAVPDDAGKLYALRKSKAAVGDSGEFQVVRPDVCIACFTDISAVVDDTAILAAFPLSVHDEARAYTRPALRNFTLQRRRHIELVFEFQRVSIATRLHSYVST